MQRTQYKDNEQPSSVHATLSSSGHAGVTGLAERFKISSNSGVTEHSTKNKAHEDKGGKTVKAEPQEEPTMGGSIGKRAPMRVHRTSETPLQSHNTIHRLKPNPNRITTLCSPTRTQ